MAHPRFKQYGSGQRRIMRAIGAYLVGVNHGELYTGHRHYTQSAPLPPTRL